MHDFKFAPRSGFTLTETAIVIGIMGAVLSALWVAVDRGWDYSKREQMKEDIRLTVEGVQGYAGAMNGVPDLGYVAMTSQLLAANVIPASMNRGQTCSGNACADHAWGSTKGGAIDTEGTFRVCNWQLGSSTTCPSAKPGNSSPFFGIALTGLAKKNCVELVQAVSSPTGPAGLVEININGTNLVGAQHVPIRPVSVADATSYCTAATNGNGTVTFVYRVSVASL